MDEGIRADLRHGTISKMLDRMVQKYGHQTAIEDGNTRISYFELSFGARRMTAALLAAGIRPGDRVAIWAPNCWEWIYAALGIHGAGAVLVPLNTHYKGIEAATILNQSAARLLFTVRDSTGTDYPALLAAAKSECPALERTILLRGDHGQSLDDFIALGDGHDADRVWASVRPEDPCDVLFTSGTTGAPRGAVCHHAQTLRAYSDWANIVGLTSDDRYLVVAPFFHCFGYKAGWLAALLTGATILPQREDDAVQVLKRLGTDQVTVLSGSPAFYEDLLAHSDVATDALPSLRLAVTGTAVMPARLILRLRKTLGLRAIVTGYGLTEACGIATLYRHDHNDETIARHCGLPIPGVEVCIVDGEGARCRPGEPGEILVRGYNVMSGFLDDEEATAAAIDAQGWLHTGDIGVLSELGDLRVTDRLKDLFVVDGSNVSPAEIESILLCREDIAQVAVIGVPDDRLGEVGMAFVVPSGTRFVDELELGDWCRSNMANFKVPRRIEVVDALPTNATGEITKFVLREWVSRRGI